MVRRELLEGQMSEKQAIKADAELLRDASASAIEAIGSICRFKVYCDMNRNKSIDKNLWDVMTNLFICYGELKSAEASYRNPRKKCLDFQKMLKSPGIGKEAQKEVQYILGSVLAQCRSLANRNVNTVMRETTNA